MIDFLIIYTLCPYIERLKNMIEMLNMLHIHLYNLIIKNKMARGIEILRNSEFLNYDKLFINPTLCPNLIPDDATVP